MLGNRTIYHDGWVAAATPVTLPWELSTKPPPDVITGYNWELYHVKEDPTEYNDLANKMPDKRKQMQDLFYAEAKKYNVLHRRRVDPARSGGGVFFEIDCEL
jgi:arylsulfatase A-like enzyme